MNSKCLTSTNEHNSELLNKQLDDYIALIALGDKQALASVFELTKSSVYGYALSVLKNPQDAEDVLQDSYIQLFRNARNYSKEGKPMAYLITIARNLCFMKLRKDKNLTDLAPEQWEEYLKDLNEVSPDERLLLNGYLSLLGSKDREIVALYVFWSFKHKEIASMLGIPLSTVLSKYSRAIKKLKNYFGEEQ